MMEALTMLPLEVPYNGLSPTAGLGFALDQFSHRHGFHSFAEWAAAQFLKGRSISGVVGPSDDLNTSAIDDTDANPATFGYEVVLWLTPAAKDV